MKLNKLNEIEPLVRLSFPFSNNELLIAYQGPNLVPSWEQSLRQEKWFRLFLPHELNGSQLNMKEGLYYLVELAKFHGSLGWRVNLGAGAAFFAGSMSYQTAKKIYGFQGACLAGSGSPTGTAGYQSGYWKVSGSWRYCTGALTSTAFTVNAKTKSGIIKTFILDPQCVHISKDWTCFALKSTQTYSIQVNNCIIPASNSFRINAKNNFPNYNLYNIDFNLFARFCMTASLLGMCYCFLRHYVSEVQLIRQRNLRHVKMLIYQLFQLCRNLENDLYKLAEKVFKEAKYLYFGRNLNQNFSQKFFPKLKILEEISFRIFSDSGLHLCSEHSLAHQALRDFWLAARHSLLS